MGMSGKMRRPPTPKLNLQDIFIPDYVVDYADAVAVVDAVVALAAVVAADGAVDAAAAVVVAAAAVLVINSGF